MERIVLFAKRPVQGKVKTRLVPPLTEVEALALYRAFLIDGFNFLGALSTPERQVEVCLDGSWRPDEEMLSALGELKRTVQGKGDLGTRMLRAFERSNADGCDAAVIVGADVPTIPRSLLDEAFRKLASGIRVVVCPALDGGYVLIGCREPEPDLFHSVPWGTPLVLETTRRHAIRSGFEIFETTPWYDVDTGEDLERLRRDLVGEPGRSRAPATCSLFARQRARMQLSHQQCSTRTPEPNQAKDRGA